MSEKAEAFLAAQFMDPEADLVQYGVKGMKWGETKVQNPIDDAMNSFDGGGDIDDLEWEDAGRNLDSAITGKKKPTAKDKVFGNDKDDGFWERTGRGAENFVVKLFSGGKVSGQGARNKRMASFVNKILGG